MALLVGLAIVPFALAARRRLVDTLVVEDGPSPTEVAAVHAQLAVAWLLTRGDEVVPLIGMRRRVRLTGNLATLDFRFLADELAVLDRAFGPGAIVGDRYPAVRAEIGWTLIAHRPARRQTGAKWARGGVG